MANVLIKDLPLVTSMNGTDTLVIDQEINGTGRVAVSQFVRTNGGIITGSLQVDGGVTGNLTGNVTGTASGNLPLTGGTLTGPILKNNILLKALSDTTYTEIWGSSTEYGGSYLTLSGKDFSGWNGRFSLTAASGSSTRCNLIGYPDGTLTWNTSNVVVESRNNAYTKTLSVSGRKDFTIFSLWNGSGGSRVAFRFYCSCNENQVSGIISLNGDGTGSAIASTSGGTTTVTSGTYTVGGTVRPKVKVTMPTNAYDFVVVESFRDFTLGFE